jgi:uncharacterized membrane protein
MNVRLDLLPLLLAWTLASFACRAAGFWLMRFVNVTPRFEAALRAAPLAVMVGIVAPAAVHGGPAEWLGLAVVAVTLKLSGNDLVATLTGVAAVAFARLALSSF